MQLFEQPEFLSNFFFFVFLKSILNFKHFPIKEDTDSWCIFEITDSEKRS